MAGKRLNIRLMEFDYADHSSGKYSVKITIIQVIEKSGNHRSKAGRGGVSSREDV